MSSINRCPLGPLGRGSRERWGGQAVIALATIPGLRRNEHVALRRFDVDDVAQTLWVGRALRTAASAGGEIGPTKTWAERVIALFPVGVEVVRGLKTVQAK